MAVATLQTKKKKLKKKKRSYEKYFVTGECGKINPLTFLLLNKSKKRKGILMKIRLPRIDRQLVIVTSFEVNSLFWVFPVCSTDADGIDADNNN